MITATLAFPSTAERVLPMPSQTSNSIFENPDDIWRLVARRDPSADGHVFYAVRTTGVFCRPSCPSRRPLRKNVEFFTDLVSAFGAGTGPASGATRRGCEPRPSWSRRCALTSTGTSTGASSWPIWRGYPA